MSDENTATSGDVHGTSDSFSSREDPSYLNNRDLALSLGNINSNMGKMASLLAKLCEKPAPKERPPGLKRQSTSAVSDNSDSESNENFHKSGKRRRQSSPSDDIISVHASDDLDDADDIIKNAHRVFKGHQPKRAGNPRQGDRAPPRLCK